jgi:geranylgeranyl reductase family protein
MISIIGGGPAGCYTAFLLAKQGKEACIVEEHSSIGSPVQCTGIVTSSINNIIRLKKDFTLNKINSARIVSGKKSAEFRLKKPNIILDREKFDRHLAEKAEDAGATIYLGEKFIKNKGENVITSKRTIKSDAIIGADGPLSSVAKANSMMQKRKCWQGIQARVKLKNENIVEFYPSTGTFAWVVPEDNKTARIGLLAEKKANSTFKNFLKKIAGKSKIIGYQGGLVPKYDPKQATQKGRVYLVGDAAGQVKATTGGGIIQGLTAAEALAHSIISNKDYEKQWKKMLGKDLWMHLKMRNIMDRFSEKDWQRLIMMCGKKKAKSVIEGHDRDYPSRFILKLLISEPRLVYFAKYIL